MIKVAFATDDRVSINQHFGATVGFAIYAIDGEHAHLVQVAEFLSDPSSNAMDGNENKLADKIDVLKGCAAVYCLAVGGSAVRQLLAAGIQPVRLDEEINIEAQLMTLRQAVREGGIPWLDKLVRRQSESDSSRFDQMVEEGWQE